MPTPEALKISELIQQTRKRLHLSQVKFAQKLGVSFHSINRWENGKTHPLPLALKQIEALLSSLRSEGVGCGVWGVVQSVGTSHPRSILGLKPHRHHGVPNWLGFESPSNSYPTPYPLPPTPCSNQMGEDGEDLLSKYFPQTEENSYDT